MSKHKHHIYRWNRKEVPNKPYLPIIEYVCIFNGRQIGKVRKSQVDPLYAWCMCGENCNVNIHGPEGAYGTSCDGDYRLGGKHCGSQKKLIDCQKAIIKQHEKNQMAAIHDKALELYREATTALRSLSCQIESGRIKNLPTMKSLASVVNRIANARGFDSFQDDPIVER